jgi:hypothetical protein
VACEAGFDKEVAQLAKDVGAGAAVEPFPNPAPPGTDSVNYVVLGP